MPIQTENTPLIYNAEQHTDVAIEEQKLTAASISAQRKLKIACLFSLSFMVAEIIGGFLAGSLAIMTDAAHLLSDVAGFLISLFALWVGTLPASSRMSYGFQRAEVIGAMISVLFIWVLTGCLVYAAIERMIEDLGPNPQERVNGKLMFIVACIGLCVNLALMKILGHSHSHGHGSHGHSHGGKSHGHSHGHSQNVVEEMNFGSNADIYKSTNKTKTKLENINIEAAYIHALGDFVQSIGVCIAGALIWYDPKYQIADPIATFLFSILVLVTTIGIVKSSVHVLMEGTPEGIDPMEIEEGLRNLPSVITTHDLHIWSLTLGKPSLSVHVIAEDSDVALHDAQDFLISKGIHHSTIQVENVTKQYPRDCAIIQCGHNSPRKN